MAQAKIAVDVSIQLLLQLSGLSISGGLGVGLPA
jgi:hypothetical protein